MALKPDRLSVPGSDDITFFMNETAERGIIVIHDTTGQGGYDDPDSVVEIPGSGSGNPAGLLMNDVVNLDLTRTHVNQHKDEVQIGGKVTLMRKGKVRTNMVTSTDTPEAGDAAYFTASGLLTTTSGSTQVGRFMSAFDSDGYVALEVDIQ